ncbi:unnamed protein product [Linum tenue]|uniref:DEAD/DEAH-box helicase domain-containing protein n=1 Tax=Linum tenue TaxID=586396 RepID=A0AAV0KTU5_9ROSI|nr:unnamed protein product [Linum tenue]
MESDSDSGGSHVSATPPRNSKPPPKHFRPAPPPPLPLRQPPRAGSKTRNKTPTSSSAAAASRSNNPLEQPPLDRKNDDDAPAVYSAPLSNLPFQICYQNRPISSSSSSHSIEALPAGYFSKSASFSKIRRTSLNFESLDESCPPPPPPPDSSTAVPAPKPNNNNNIRKNINLIRAEASPPPVKLRKCSGGSEGNFVKLNTNYKNKFLNRKGMRKSSSSYASNNRRLYRRSKRKLKADSEAAEAGGSLCDEEGLVTEITQQKAENGGELIEEAVSAARGEPSDENLVRLLSLMYGYSSFRNGQLEAIRMVLDGKSAMLVLPTGAGKSLCYQIPAVILPGITLVVSPLVALMIDQLKQLPAAIQGGLFCSSQVSFLSFSQSFMGFWLYQ